MHQRSLFSTFVRFLLPAATVILLCACGQKGPLTLPQQPAPVAEEQEKMEENSATMAMVGSEHDGLL
ncbi:MAG: lipoprotein [Alkalimonas sp.]|nr:lipoprotein [Alkalimonas sp.]